MAFESLYLHLLKDGIDKAKRGRPRARALLLSYPDLLAPRAALVGLFGEEVVSQLKQRDNAADVWKWHGLDGCTEPLYDSLGLMQALGLDCEIIDVVQVTGVERIVDLNFPLPEDLKNAFDLVVDTGTCEHCFNVGQAFMNACGALSEGGVLVHAAPLTRINHGFWGFSPTVYPDFAEHNGFRIHTLSGVSGNLAGGFRPFNIDPFRRVTAPDNSALYVLMQRERVAELRWPVQRKYQHFIKSEHDSVATE